MTGEEIIEVLESNGVSGSDFKYGYFNDYNGVDLGKSEVVEKVGGSEGDGEYACVTRHFIDHDVYVKLEGFYSSYGEGMTWDDNYFLVRPVQRMVTFYE